MASLGHSVSFFFSFFISIFITNFFLDDTRFLTCFNNEGRKHNNRGLQEGREAQQRDNAQEMLFNVSWAFIYLVQFFFFLFSFLFTTNYLFLDTTTTMASTGLKMPSKVFRLYLFLLMTFTTRL